MGFNSWQDYEKFVAAVKYKTRFIHSDEIVEFLNSIRGTLREFALPRGSQLFRAQVGCRKGDRHQYEGGAVIEPFEPGRMKPEPLKAKEGRANPKGIPCLYLADDENTSLAETRPEVGEYLSLGQFLTNKDLRLVDCNSVEPPNHYTSCLFNPPKSQEEIACAIWTIIGRAFTRPVVGDDSSADYVPTQLLAELFKSAGYDGVRYKSNLGPGHNFALFDLGVADVTSRTLRKTEAVSYSFKDEGNFCPSDTLTHQDYM